MATVLVIGGAGYIGSHTCKYLHGDGITPVVFDNLCEGHRDFVRWGDLVEGDIRDRDAITKAIASVKPDAIIHFAAFSSVGESVGDPAKYYDTNVAGTLNVAIAARDAGNIPIVFSSTAATYGIPDSALISEDLPTKPINPYGWSKLMVETMLRDFSNAYGLRSVCLRYFNACGADVDCEIGEAHQTETHLVPRAIFAGLGKLDEFCVFGDDYDTEDGSAVRDYIHVTDLAQAHALACRYLWDGGETDCFNVGTGSGTSVFQIINAIEAVAGMKVPHTIGPRRAGDPPKLVADPSRAQDVLGFQAKLSDIETVVRTAAKWHKAQFQIHD